MILIDLLKIFYTIDHDKHLCFSKNLVNWFRSYLINIKFLVNLGNAFSQPVCMFSGVPRGSNLGHVLFLLYADDTCLVCKHKDINEI